MKKDNEMEPFLGEAVGASGGDLGGRSWCLFKVPRHRGFEATRRRGQEVDFRYLMVCRTDQPP